MLPFLVVINIGTIVKVLGALLLVVVLIVGVRVNSRMHKGKGGQSAGSNNSAPTAAPGPTNEEPKQ